MGTKGTTGFIGHHGWMGTVCTHTWDRYSVYRYGYGVQISNLQYTCDEPYPHHYLIRPLCPTTATPYPHTPNPNATFQQYLHPHASTPAHHCAPQPLLPHIPLLGQSSPHAISPPTHQSHSCTTTLAQQHTQHAPPPITSPTMARLTPPLGTIPSPWSHSHPILDHNPGPLDLSTPPGLLQAIRNTHILNIFYHILLEFSLHLLTLTQNLALHLPHSHSTTILLYPYLQSPPLLYFSCFPVLLCEGTHRNELHLFLIFRGGHLWLCHPWYQIPQTL